MITFMAANRENQETDNVANSRAARPEQARA